MTTPAPGFIESAIKYWHVASEETGDASETSDQLYQAIQALPADACIVPRSLLTEAANLARTCLAHDLCRDLEQAAATKGEQT